MTLTLSEAKSWSMLTPYPVIVEDNCYWSGILITKSMAMCLVGLFFFKIGITPEQKRVLWQQAVEQFRRLDDGTLGFNIFDYNEESHFRYINHTIYTSSIKDKVLNYTKEHFIRDFILKINDLDND